MRHFFLKRFVRYENSVKIFTHLVSGRFTLKPFFIIHFRHRILGILNDLTQTLFLFLANDTEPSAWVMVDAHEKVKTGRYRSYLYTRSHQLECHRIEPLSPMTNDISITKAPLAKKHAREGYIPFLFRFSRIFKASLIEKERRTALTSITVFCYL